MQRGNSVNSPVGNRVMTAMQGNQGARAAPTTGGGLALAGLVLAVVPLALFGFMLWLTDGAPLRPPAPPIDSVVTPLAR